MLTIKEILRLWSYVGYNDWSAIWAAHNRELCLVTINFL